jgi:hypothetical protein
MNQLRGCYSEVAVERACLRVSSALIHLAASRECHNRFLCIQQAALFASQASKGGSSDQYFHSPLPTIESCTPLDALLTIGRSDCMQAVGFYPEAVFLCTYVVSACRLQRGRQVSKSTCVGVWKILSVLAYDLSVAIRYAAKVGADDNDRIESMQGIWEGHVIDELKRAFSEGLNLKAFSVPEALGQIASGSCSSLPISTYGNNICERETTNTLLDNTVMPNQSITLNNHSKTDAVPPDRNLDPIEHDGQEAYSVAGEIIEV